MNLIYFTLFYVFLIIISNVSCKKENYKIKKVINKCCPNNEYVIEKSMEDHMEKICVPKNNVSLDFRDVPLYTKNKKITGNKVKSVYDFAYGIINNINFSSAAVDYSSIQNGHNYYLSEEGLLYQEAPNQYIYWMEWTRDSFCLDYKLDPVTTDVLGPTFWSVFVDSSNSENSSKDPFLYVIGMFISCFFLVLVLVVYCLLPGYRVLSELVQMTYVASTLGGFFFLALILTPGIPLNSEACTGLSYVTYFFLMASFSWMAVMSYDLWCLHRGRNFSNRSTRRKMLKRFRLYSICAWSIPAALTIFLITVNHLNLRHIPWFITPNIPLYSCFLYREKLLYFYVPISILILFNWIFFFMTSFSLWKQYKMTANVDVSYSTQKDHRSIKNRFLMYLKLSVITGISWALEVGSYFSPNLDVWYVSDCYNMLIGFFMFLILVCNKKTYKKLKKRFEPNTISTRVDSVDTIQI